MIDTSKRDTARLQLVASVAAANNLSQGCTFVTWSELIPQIVLAFTKASDAVWPLPELADDQRDALLLDYNDMIADIGVESGRDSVWWYTWTSSREGVFSHILADMELMARFQKACEQGLPDRLVMLCQNPHLSGALLDIAKRNGVKTQVAVKDRLRWIRRRFTMRVSPLIGAIRTCRRILSIRSRIKQDDTYLEEAKLKPERTLLVTWIKPGNLLESAPPGDTYFGPLPKLLVTDEHSVTVFGDIYLGLPLKQGRSGDRSPSPVLTAAPFISNWAIFRAFIRGFLSPVAVHKALKSEKAYLASLVERDVYSNRASIVYGLLIEDALRHLLETLRPTQIIHMCENNPWERACVQAARSVTPEPEVTGYLHCAVLLSHTKNIITEKEKPVRPRPSKLICTGDRARDIMVRFGGHSPGEVVGACALRHAYMADFQPRGKLNQPILNILVVLEGLSSVSHLVRLVYECLDDDERFQTVIRPHPAVGIDGILHDSGVSISDFKTLKLSEQSHITQDFQNADVVIYKSSTAAVEAGYMGIPLIRYSHPNLLTDDPLFETTSLKQVVGTPEELLLAIQTFASMDHGQYLQQSKILRQYIDEYLTTPGPEHVNYFLRGSPKVAVYD